MKKIFLKGLSLIFLFSLGINAKAQCLNVNGDLQTFTGSIVTYPRATANVWINTHLNNWTVSHGSPSFSGSNIWMWSYDGDGEGIYTDFAFIPGMTYSVTYDLWMDGTSNPTSQFNVKLVGAMVPYIGGTARMPPPTPALTYPLPVVTWSGGWTTITEIFTVPSSGSYNHLWFHPNLAGLAVPNQASCIIDNICIQENPFIEPCDFEPIFSISSYGSCELDFTNTTIIPPGLTLLETYWDFGDGATAKGTAVKHYYQATGVYNVCMTVWVVNLYGECCKLEYCQEIDGIACDPCDMINSINFSVGGTAPTLTFAATGLPTFLYDILGYQWDLGDGNSATGQSVTHTYLPGIYTVTLTVYYFDPIAEMCCSAKISQTGTIPAIISDDGEEGRAIFGNEKVKETEGVSIEPANSIIISPNPSNGVFEIRLKDGAEINSVDVYDQSGKLQYSIGNENKNGQVSLNLSHLDAGIYIIITDSMNEQNRQFSKFIIE